MWYDSEVYGGSKKSNVAALDIFYGPNNKKNDPCSTCPMASTCEYEWKALKNVYSHHRDFWHSKLFIKVCVTNEIDW